MIDNNDNNKVVVVLDILKVDPTHFPIQSVHSLTFDCPTFTSNNNKTLPFT